MSFCYLMLLKTHLIFAIFAIILFVNFVNDKLIFVSLVLLATFLPDIDSGFSTLGRRAISKPIQLITRHRGLLHSFTFVVFISIILSVYWPVASLGFFLGYALHILGDSFTKDGVQAFWPLKVKSSGFIATGGKIEETLFFSMIIINIILFLIVFMFR